MASLFSRAVLCAFLALVCSASGDVPVLGWSSKPSLFPAQGDFVLGQSADDVVKTQLNKVCSQSEGTTLLFIQDELSINDFSEETSSHGLGFKLSRDSMDSSTSKFVVPSVLHYSNVGSRLVSSIEESCSQLGEPVVVYSQDEARKLSFEDQAPRLVVIHLDPVASALSDSDRGAILISNDKFVHEFARLVEDMTGNAVTVVLTGKQSSAQAVRERRDVSDASSPSLGQGIPNFVPYISLRRDQRHDIVYQYFTFPIFMGIMIMFVLIFFVLVGIFGLMGTQTNEQWPDYAVDKNLVTPLE